MKGGRWWWIGAAAALAAMAYAPLLAVRPGVVTSGHQDLPLPRPRRASSRQAAFMWNPDGGPGRGQPPVHRLPPADGPVLLASSTLLGVPVWVAQRLWLGSILFAAGLGVLYLCADPGTARPRAGRWPAPAYMLSPYFLQYAGRISVILLPWAGTAVHGGPDHRRPAARRLARARPLCRGRGDGERHQRQLASSTSASRRSSGSSTPSWSAGVDLAPRGRYRPAHRRCSRWARALCGGSPACRSRRPTGSTSSSSPRPCPRRRPHPTRRTSSVASATGTSTAPTTSARGRMPPFATPRTSGPVGHLLRGTGGRSWQRYSCAGASAPTS